MAMVARKLQRPTVIRPKIRQSLSLRIDRRLFSPLADQLYGFQPIYRVVEPGVSTFVEADRKRHTMTLRRQPGHQHRRLSQTDSQAQIHHPDLDIDEAMRNGQLDLETNLDHDLNIYSPGNLSAIPDDIMTRQNRSNQPCGRALPQSISELPGWSGGHGSQKEPIPVYPFRPSSPQAVPRGLPIGNLNMYSGSHTQTGFKVSKGDGKVHTRRKWHPNVHLSSLPSVILGVRVPLRTTVRILRTIRKEGGLDHYLVSDSPDRLQEMGEWGWRLRWLMLRQNRQGVAKILMEKRERHYVSRLQAAERPCQIDRRQCDAPSSRNKARPSSKITHTI